MAKHGKTHNHIRRSLGDHIFNGANIVLFILISLIIPHP